MFYRIVLAISCNCCLFLLSQAQSSLSITDAYRNFISPSTKIPERSLRLPNTTYPELYKLHVNTEIHLNNFEYQGSVTIDIKVRQSTNEIVLHAKELTDFKVVVRDLPSGILRNDTTFSYDRSKTFLIIYSQNNSLPYEANQKLRVEVTFKGVMQSEAKGIYWLNYTLPSNETMYLAATQFEPTSARLAFPCYDEPAFKANFKLSVTHSCTYDVIANMPVESTRLHELNENLETTTFEMTPKISTYLIAFVIYKNFDMIKNTSRGVEQRLYTPSNGTNNGQLALNNAVDTVATIEGYFGVNYTLKKLDHIALNKNYGSAMENWGLITYKHDDLLYSDEADIHSKLKDTLTVNHEIVHQWFGNLVSPEWWSYAWLNEGFATYFAFVLTEKMNPEYKAMEFFLIEVTDRAYTYCQITVRPMTHYVESETEIRAAFDIISYQKAACVIKMFHHAFSENTFMRGVTNYLRTYQFSYANELNLFSALQSAVELDNVLNKKEWSKSIADIMLSWTHSEWIPIVTVQVNTANKTLTLTQHSNGPREQNYWWIPINFATRSAPNFENTTLDYMIPPKQNITINFSDLGLPFTSGDWLIANKQQTGFYHVHYDSNNLRAIAMQLLNKHSQIHKFSRAAIFRDLTPLIENNGIESMEVVLDLLSYLRKEKNLLIWYHVGDVIVILERNLYDSKSHLKFKQFVRHLIRPIFKKLFKDQTMKNLSSIELFARQKILEVAYLTDLDLSFEYARRFTNDYLMGRADDLEVRDVFAIHETLLCLSVKQMNDTTFEALTELLQNANRSSLWYDNIIFAMRCLQNSTHLNQYLNILVNDEKVTDGDSIMYVLYLFKSNLKSRPLVLEFIENNVKALCGSSVFIENINRLAEYIPKEHREKFNIIRNAIDEESTKLKNAGNDKIEINWDMSQVGKKVLMSEMFVEKFGQQIYIWLSKYNTKLKVERARKRKTSASKNMV